MPAHLPSSAHNVLPRRATAAALQDSIAAFNWVLNNLLTSDHELHLLHVVPDVFTSPASGSIYYCSSPDPETERALVSWADERSGQRQRRSVAGSSWP